MQSVEGDDGLFRAIIYPPLLSKLTRPGCREKPSRDEQPVHSARITEHGLMVTRRGSTVFPANTILPTGHFVIRRSCVKLGEVARKLFIFRTPPSTTSNL